MPKLMRLVLLDLRILTRNKLFYLKLILFPSLLILILGTVFKDSGSPIQPFEVAFYNADTNISAGTHAVSFGDVLRDNVFSRADISGIIHVQEVNSYAQGEQAVADGQASVFVSVPEAFTNAVMANAGTHLFLAGDNGADKEIVRTILVRYAANLGRLDTEQRKSLQAISSSNAEAKSEEAIGQLTGVDTLSLTISDNSAPKETVSVNAMQYYSIAMVVMFSIMTAFVLVHSIVDEKQNHTLFRIKSTPTRDIQYVLSKLAGIIGTVVLQMTIVILISRLVFQVDWGNPGYLLLITAAYAFTMGSIILLWGFTAKDHVTVSSLASPVLYVFSFLGGSFVNKSGLPESLRVIQAFIPNGKALNSYLKVCQGAGLRGIYTDLLELIGLGLVFLFCNLRVYSGKRWSKHAICSNGKSSSEADVSK